MERQLQEETQVCTGSKMAEGHQGPVAQACDLKAQRAETGRMKFKASLDYRVRSRLKKTKQGFKFSKSIIQQVLGSHFLGWGAMPGGEPSSKACHALKHRFCRDINKAGRPESRRPAAIRAIQGTKPKSGNHSTEKVPACTPHLGRRCP